MKDTILELTCCIVYVLQVFVEKGTLYITVTKLHVVRVGNKIDHIYTFRFVRQ